MTSERSKFQRGSGCYTCTACGKRTRAVDADAASCGICALCYARSCAGNELSDSGYRGDAWAVFTGCANIEEVETRLTAELRALGQETGGAK